MSVKLALLKSGETLITDVKELVTEETEEKERKVHGYLFVKPKKVDLAAPILLTENSDSKEESSVQVSLSAWSLITKDTEFAIAKDWVVTFMEPADRLTAMYEESLND